MKKKKFLFATIALIGLAIGSLFTSPIRSNAAESHPDELHEQHASENLFNASDPTLEFGHGGYAPSGWDEGDSYTYCVITVETDTTYHITHPKFYDLMSLNSSNVWGWAKYNESDRLYGIDASGRNLNIGVCFTIPSSLLNGAKTAKISLAINECYDDVGSYIDIFEETILKRIDLTAPAITVSANYIVNVDYMQSQAQILSHVVVDDDNDPNPQLVVRSTSYNASNRVCGNYTMTVYALDAYGNQSPDYTFNIIVADSTKPSCSGFKTISQPNNLQLSETEILNQFTISDNYSSAANVSKTLIKNDYTANWTRPGQYEVVCRATDEAGNNTDTSSYIQVVDKVNPTIAGNNTTIGNNVQLTRENLLALFTAEDDYSEGSKITKTILTDSYSSSWKKPGTYQVTCRATDEAGNYSDATAEIVVEDKTAPELNIQNIDAQYHTKLTDLKSLFSYLDDVTELEAIVFEIVTDNYTTNYNIKGNYTVRARVTDAAGNSNEASAVVRVVDTTKPVITVPTEIKVGNNTLVETSSFKAKIVVEDGYDGTITNYSINDLNDYANNYQKLGSYKFEITATDESGNTQKAFFQVIVTDTTSPKIYYDKYYICLSEGEVLTDEMIKSYASIALGLDVASVLSVEGDYDVEATGEYSVSLFMLDGSVQPFTISVGEQKEPAKWTAKGFFSTDITNWAKFDEWPAWSICSWLIWVAIGLGSLVVAAVAVILVKKVYKAIRK